MAALGAFRPVRRGLMRPPTTLISNVNAFLGLNRTKALYLAHAEKVCYSLFRPSEAYIKPPEGLSLTPTPVRHVNTSSVELARFQRPPALTADDVDWSKMDSLNSSHKHSFDPNLVERLFDTMENDMPVSDMPDPFEKNYKRCFLCRHDVYLDHKNVRLLSQFVSPHTGRIYGRAITGLCIPMQKRVALLIKRARMSGYMPFIFKDPKYLYDPQPYDAMTKKF
ncbi:30S ribosomal protein S18 [Elysia marginata]|uniref:30S ribosomal protein S18 n=1 Tax=Elysia marginata TaxID=1093978 RepID=A0AAV4IVJ4_9GAST|nr:30S ribosomal protein S18 [Elysia marginata]